MKTSSKPNNFPSFKQQSIHKSSPFSNNLIQIININSNNVSDPFLKYSHPEHMHTFSDTKSLETAHFYELMSKLDQIIEESRKTQELIKSKQEINKIPLNIATKYQEKQASKDHIIKILNGLHIPNSMENGLINNLALRRICQQNLYETQSEISLSPIKKTNISTNNHINDHNNDELKNNTSGITCNEKNLLEKIKKIKENSGFDMIKFIENLYDLAIQNQQCSPMGKSTVFGKKTFQNEEIPEIKEDLTWKEINREEDGLFYKESLCDNNDANYLAFQAMDTAYSRLLGVYMKAKTCSK